MNPWRGKLVVISFTCVSVKIKGSSRACSPDPLITFRMASSTENDLCPAAHLPPQEAVTCGGLGLSPCKRSLLVPPKELRDRMAGVVTQGPGEKIGQHTEIFQVGSLRSQGPPWRLSIVQTLPSHIWVLGTDTRGLRPFPRAQDIQLGRGPFLDRKLNSGHLLVCLGCLVRLTVQAWCSVTGTKWAEHTLQSQGGPSPK